MRTLFTSIIMAAGLLVSFSANSMVVYNVSNATTECGIGHGLWANGFKSGCDRFFGFNDGSTLTVDTDTGIAVLDATATNKEEITADIDITFGGFTDDHTDISMIKNGGGGNPSVWDFFTSIIHGTIGFTSGQSFDIPSMVPGTALQVGVGANDKTSDLGASVWIRPVDMSWYEPIQYSNWDLNIKLTQVPEPGSLALLAFGMIGLFVIRRRKV